MNERMGNGKQNTKKTEWGRDWLSEVKKERSHSDQGESITQYYNKLNLRLLSWKNP